MSFWDDVFTPQLGAQIGQALGTAWMGNLARGRIDAAKQAAQQIAAPTADELKQARNALGQQYQGIVGSTPQQGIINSKRKYEQAQNDAQYLLDHGYDEKSQEVQNYRNQQQAAHNDADQFRNLATSKGLDMSKYGEGATLQQLNDLAALGQQYGALGAQGITNPYAANKLSLGVNTNFLPQAGIDDAQKRWKQAQNDAQYLLNHGYAEDSADVQKFRQMQATAHDTAEQLRNSPDAVAGQMAGNTVQPGQQQPASYGFNLQDVQQAAKQMKDNPNTITIQDLYNTFGNGLTYDTAVNQAAKALAANRMQTMQSSLDYKEMMKAQLVKRGIDPGVADKYLADEEAKHNEKLKQLAQAALVASMKNNPQGATLVNYMIRSGADPKDIVSAFDKSKGNYSMGQVDTDDKKYAIMFDKNGLLPGNMQAFNVGISPYHKGTLAVTQRGQDMSYKTAAMKENAANQRKNAELSQNMYLYQKGYKGKSGQGGSSGKDGSSLSNDMAVVKAYQEYADKHPGEHNPYESAAEIAQGRLDNHYGVSHDPDNYSSAMSDVTDVLEGTADKIKNGSTNYWTKDQITDYINNKYGDMADTILDGINWGDYGL